MANRDGTAEVLVTHQERIQGLLAGCAVGDSIGLPAEGLSKERIRRRWKGVWQQRLLFRHGLVSDDTEHTWMTADCLVRCNRDVDRFRKLMGWKLRLWFAAVPPGVGLATARACLKLWTGFPTTRSGVHSAGNGPAMRSAIIGACHHKEPALLRDLVRASTVMTHSDPRALTGSLAIALCAAWICRADDPGALDRKTVLQLLAQCDQSTEWQTLVQLMDESCASGLSMAAFTEKLGCGGGVSGYVFHTVPAAIYAWLRHGGDYRSGIEAVCNCGGDTDTVAAIAGALMGATGGFRAVPTDWQQRTLLWPSSWSVLDQMASALAGENSAGFRCYRWPVLFAKNVVMLPTVLCHGLRRLLPP